MNIFLKLVGITLTCMMIVNGISQYAYADEGVFATAPTTNQGKKWRIGYYEGGPYFEYQKVLNATIRGLMKLGWIDRVELPEQSGEETETLWGWLVDHARSDYLEFVKNGHYSSNWNEEGLRKEITDKIIDRLKSDKDIDLMIAMGTWAGKDLATNEHETSTLVFAASDPIAAGIIKSIDDSGLSHVHAAVDPAAYERQIRIFHEMINFKKLGLAYENSVEGRSYAAVEVIEKSARDLGFEIVRCYTKSDIPDLEAAGRSVIECFQKLVKQVDAIYVTMQGGVRQESIPELVETANQNRIPTFSQAGSEEVKYGFLASISQANFNYIGEFNATTIAKVLNGVKPNQLEQRFEPPPKIAINLKTAEIIDFNPPIILLGAADEIYNEIAGTSK